MTNQTTSGLERQIGPFSGPYLDIGPDRDQVPKSGPFRCHCLEFKTIKIQSFWAKSKNFRPYFQNKLASLEATLVRNYDPLTDRITDGGEV